MTEIERLEEIRSFFKKNKTEFANLLGYKHRQNYIGLLSGKTGISTKVINTIKNADERISIDWLLWGQGSMLLSENSINNANAPIVAEDDDRLNFDEEYVQLLKDRIEDKEALLENNKVTMSLYQDRIATLEKELEELRHKVSDLK